jgi:hypothetical protein
MTDFNGGDGSVENPYQIVSWTQLNRVRNYLDKNFILMNSLSSADADYIGIGDSWIPIKGVIQDFSGSFNGNYYVIQGLIINKPNEYYHGLFGTVYGINSVLNNITLTDVNIISGGVAGALAGQIYVCNTIINCISSGNIQGDINTYGNMIGGLVGELDGGVIENCSSSCTVSGFSGIGGLLGYGFTYTDNCYATGNINGEFSCGGLCGYFDIGIMSNCYATGNVTGTGNDSDFGSFTAGLVGYMYSTVINCYSTGKVVGVTSPYVTSVRGLVIFDELAGVEITVTDSYYDSQTSLQSDTGYGEPKTTAQMKTASTFSAWDNSIWSLLDGRYPLLYWQVYDVYKFNIDTLLKITSTIISGNVEINSTVVDNQINCSLSSSNYIDSTISNSSEINVSMERI